MRYARIRDALAKASHVQVGPRLDDAAVTAEEARLGVRFPDEYRGFLREVGDGVGAPGYTSLYPLAQIVLEGNRLVLCDHGCNELSSLTVIGPQHGEVWRTGEVELPETRALYGGEGDAPLGFLDWFEVWCPCVLARLD